EEGHTGLGPALGAGPRLGPQIGSGGLGPRELRNRAQRSAGPSPSVRPAMSSGPRTPRTPFSIADILGPRTAPRGPSALQLPASVPGPTTPLCALEELTSKTFRGLDLHAPPPSEGVAPGGATPGALAAGRASRRRRKSRTAFTAQQVLELERRFVFQKYLAPSERDGLAAKLGLANAQVVTWFQNRRAKLKREVEEMRADLASLRTLSPDAQCHLATTHSAPGPGRNPGLGPARPDSGLRLSDEEIQ
ncbi:Transcription factor LBX2, partial [Galemys pyrenaicus]